MNTRIQHLSHGLLRFLRTPKGLLLVIFVGLTVLSSLKLGADVAISKVVVAAVVAAACDVPLSYIRRRRWVLPDGAVLTGAIVAFVLRPEEDWLTLIVLVVIAILSKHVLRTRWSNVLNPAALALVVGAIAFNTGQNWWGALPDLGIAGAIVLLVAGGFIAHRINKLPMILTFFAVYFTSLTVASVFRSSTVAETFITPDLQAVLFFAFFMLDDPPTCPVRYSDQIVFGAIVASVAYFIFMQVGGVYFLLAGLLAGNIWESARRVVISRTRGRAPVAVQGQRPPLPLAARGVVAVAILLPLTLAFGLVGTSEPLSGGTDDPSAAAAPSGADANGRTPPSAPGASGSSTPYPFLATFEGDVSGNYTQTSDATNSRLVLDGVATGDLSVGMHVELAQTSVVPTPDDETAEASPDDEAREAQPVVTTTVNSAQLLDPASKGLLCDGKLTALNRGAMRLSCDGVGPYGGVQMQIGSQLNAGQDGTFSGALNGQMQRTG